MAQQSGEDLLKIVDELLSLSKLEAGKLVLLEQAVLLYRLIRRLTAAFESYAQKENITYELFFEPNTYLTIQLDQKKLSITYCLMLLNLPQLEGR